MTDVKTTEGEGNKPGRRRKKNLRTKDMTDVKTRNGKEINQEEEEKKTFGQRI